MLLFKNTSLLFSLLFSGNFFWGGQGSDGGDKVVIGGSPSPSTRENPTLFSRKLLAMAATRIFVVTTVISSTRQWHTLLISIALKNHRAKWKLDGLLNNKVIHILDCWNNFIITDVGKFDT